MWPFTPRYIKHAKLLHKGVTRFMDYKRDLLPAEKLSEISALRDELTAAIKGRNRAKIDELNQTLNQICERALPDHQPSAIAENVEIVFVSIAIALGIRAYIAQPFQIPTGSMQPTLNGFIAESADTDPRPALPMQVVDWFKGKKYFNVVSDHTGYLRRQEPVTEHRWLLLFTFSRIHFEDGHYITVHAPMRQLQAAQGLGLSKHLSSPMKAASNAGDKDVPMTADAVPLQRLSGGLLIREGQILARGVLTTGDHVIVNKMAYHFRTPTRAEVFVFTTKNISGIERQSNFDQRWGSQHYIKRLVGVPGDHIEVASTGKLLRCKNPDGDEGVRESGTLLINGKPPVEPQIQRVAAAQEPGYNGYFVVHPGESNDPISGRTLSDTEYCAMGDNSFASADSRYWGSVPRRNLVGVGFFTYWPFGPHWGLID